MDQTKHKQHFDQSDSMRPDLKDDDLFVLEHERWKNSLIMTEFKSLNPIVSSISNQTINELNQLVMKHKKTLN